jgi:hypothetical protein
MAPPSNNTNNVQSSLAAAGEHAIGLAELDALDGVADVGRVEQAELIE